MTKGDLFWEDLAGKKVRVIGIFKDNQVVSVLLCSGGGLGGGGH